MLRAGEQPRFGQRWWTRHPQTGTAGYPLLYLAPLRADVKEDWSTGIRDAPLHGCCVEHAAKVAQAWLRERAQCEREIEQGRLDRAPSQEVAP
jgi:hypothetical protein